MRAAIASLLLLFILCGSALAISADLGQIGIGARPLAMGKAYLAFGSDGSAIFMNPAGLALNPAMKFTTMSGKLLDDITYTTLAFANNTEYGNLGVGYINAGTAGIPLTNLITYPTGTYEVSQYDSIDYSSSVFYLAYANEWREGITYGGNFKLFSQGFSKDSGSMEGASGVGMDLDLGAQWRVDPRMTFAILLQNIVPATLGGRFVWKRGSVEEGIPAYIKLGSSFKLVGEDGFSKIRDNIINVNLDSELSPTLPRPNLWHVGVEWWPYEFLAVRSGVDQKVKAGNAGALVQNDLTAGLGLVYKGFSFDYAYHQFGELYENASHFFSIGYLGAEVKKEKKELEEQKKKLEKEGFKLELKAKPSEMKKFSDVPDGFWAKDAITYLATLGFINGYPDGTFKPNEPLTRAELASLLVKAKDFQTEILISDIFPDVPVSHWAAPYVQVALNRKYVGGYPDGNFRPWKKVSRAEGVVIISKFAGLTEPMALTYNPYPDVEKRHWAARSIAVAKANGLLEFLAGKNFEPDRLMTRAEAAEMISKTDFAKDKIKELLKK